MSSISTSSNSSSTITKLEKFKKTQYLQTYTVEKCNRLKKIKLSEFVWSIKTNSLLIGFLIRILNTDGVTNKQLDAKVSQSFLANNVLLKETRIPTIVNTSISTFN